MILVMMIMIIIENKRERKTRKIFLYRKTLVNNHRRSVRMRKNHHFITSNVTINSGEDH